MSFTAVAFQLSDAQLEQLPTQIIGQASSAFSRHHRGKFGFGERYRFCTHGPQRFSNARDRWDELTSASVTAVPTGFIASAPVCFAAFSFDARSDVDSVVTVPKYVLDVGETSTWLHYQYDASETIATPETVFAAFISELPADTATVGDATFTYLAAQMTETAFQDSVQAAVAMLAEGGIEKVVLAAMSCCTAPPVFTFRPLCVLWRTIIQRPGPIKLQT